MADPLARTLFRSLDGRKEVRTTSRIRAQWVGGFTASRVAVYVEGAFSHFRVSLESAVARDF